MPVIINDLEVILETPEAAAADEAAPPPPQAPESAALTPQTLERIEAHRRSRAMRVRAH